MKLISLRRKRLKRILSYIFVSNMPMLGVSEKELKRGREKLRKFVRNNPYRSYNFVANDLILKQEKDTDQFAEYGTPNHDWMKEI